MDQRTKIKIANSISSTILLNTEMCMLDEADLHEDEKRDILKLIEKKACSIRPKDGCVFHTVAGIVAHYAGSFVEDEAEDNYE